MAFSRRFLFVYSISTCLFLALSAPFPANAKSICSYLLAGPQGYYLRFLAGFYPIPQGRLIRGAQTISSDTLTDTDKGVWEESNRNGKFKEVQIFEALDRNGNIIATSEFVAGDFLHVKPADAFQSLMKKLDLIFPNRAAWGKRDARSNNSSFTRDQKPSLSFFRWVAEQQRTDF